MDPNNNLDPADLNVLFNIAGLTESKGTVGAWWG